MGYHIYNNPAKKEFRRRLRKNQTEPERKLWSRLRKKHLKGSKFFRQYSVGPYILDFYCPAIRLAIEADGSEHAEELQIVHDEKRTLYLKERNIKVLRFWNNEILNNLDTVEEIIWREVGDRS